LTPAGGGRITGQVKGDELERVAQELLEQVQAVAEPTLEETARRFSSAAAVLHDEHARLAAEHRQLLARNAELERDVRARDELLSVIGHELRNPISPLFMHVRALLMDVRGPERKHLDADWLTQRLERMERHIQRFLSVLDRILDVSRLSAGGIDLQLERLDLGELVSEVVARYEQEAAAAGCTLSVQHQGVVHGTWDRLRVEQIVSNLVSNALRYGAGAPVELTVYAQQAQAVIEVRDHGVGIAAEDQERIFERFERAKRREQGGFGVGLWVVKNLCNALGGRISVSSAPAQGATFSVSLPLGARANT
jgi:two-component system OmpR family sensor kinase